MFHFDGDVATRSNEAVAERVEHIGVFDGQREQRHLTLCSVLANRTSDDHTTLDARLGQGG